MGGCRVPLSETTRELLEPTEDQELESPELQTSTWIQAVEHLWSKRGKLAAWVALGLAMSIFVGWRLPKYEATAQLMPPDSNSSGLGAMLAASAMQKAPGFAGLSGLAGDMFGIKSSGALFSKVLQSRTIADKILEKYKIQDYYHSPYPEDARKKLSSRTEIEEDKKSGVLTLKFRDHNRDMARNVLNAYIEELNNVLHTVATSSAGREREFLEGRLTEEKNLLDDAQQKFSHFASANMALDIPEQTRVTVEAASRLQGELIANRAQLEGLEQIYTPENFRVKSLRAHVGELERQLTRLNGAKPAANQVQDPTNPYPSVKNLPALGVQWSDLYRTIKIHETVYELLTQQYEMARIQEAKDTPVVKVLDKPDVSQHKFPNPGAIVMGGLLLSIVLACSGVLLQWKWARWNEKDPRRVLLVRMYSGTRESISSIWTGRSKKKKNRDQVY
jgi:uncharacterized protein involved in exopolysaccharide biosynthesis